MDAVRDLIPHLRAATEAAAIAAHAWLGRGDGKAADGAAVKAMRATFDRVPFDGRVAIGEGERDDAPMLYIGEPLGSAVGQPGAPRIDIAVDPLECTTNCALDRPNALAVLAAAPRGTLLHAPDCYMDKLAGGPDLAGRISLDASIEWNVEAVADVRDKTIEDVTVTMLDRPRHADHVTAIEALGAKVDLISDGDIAGALRAADPESPTDLLLGIGAAPEGVITATALLGVGGVFEGRLNLKDEEERHRAEAMVGDDIDRLWSANDLCASEDAVFVATGVCPGYLPGVETIPTGLRTTTEVIDVAASRRYTVENEHST